MALLLAACREAPARLSVSLVDSVAGIVLVHGLEQPERVTIQTGIGLPPLAGQYDVADGAVRFTPRFSVEGVASLLVTVDTQRWTLLLSARAQPEPSTRVVAIHPSAPVVPANQLRWYLEFSAPMREGEALKHVSLRDGAGHLVDKAFLEVDEELWDPTRTRLTLLFDMGRVKQGIQSRADLGPVLRAGGRYTLEIDKEWPDARGAALVADSVHRFRVGPELHQPIDPARWAIGAVHPGSRTPLMIEIGYPLDHALAERMIAVTSGDGERMAGTLTLLDGDRRLQYVPATAWLAIPYQLRVHPALEDVAGNRVGHAFDARLAAGESAGVEQGEVVLAISTRR